MFLQLGLWGPQTLADDPDAVHNIVDDAMILMVNSWSENPTDGISQVPPYAFGYHWMQPHQTREDRAEQSDKKIPERVLGAGITFPPIETSSAPIPSVPPDSRFS